MVTHKDNHRAHKVTVFNILMDRKIRVISDNITN